MNKKGLAVYALLIVLLPIAILILSGNAMLRVSASYGYHFNDIQASDMVDSSLSNAELAGEITGYFNSFGGDEEFQIYEQNGEFLDPVFDDLEVLAMKRAKRVMTWTLVAGGIVFVSVLIIYVYLALKGEKRTLRISGIIAAAVTFAALIAKIVLVVGNAFRGKLYARFIGVALSEESSLRLILGSPMERVYLVFSSVFALILIIVFLYITLRLTKEKGMFSGSIS
ncbi:MAG: hypothetical protein J5928_05150 [Firmicutes bacterium]|nr:hypothetical protein [Bacillota bacterium]